MTKRICVGDLHGDLELYRIIKAKFPHYLLTLMGDLLDSFVFSRTEQLTLLQEVLNDIESGRVECILGNHELSYLYPDKMKCSGFSSHLHTHILSLKSRMFKLMKPFILDEDDALLITHAGLSKSFLSSQYLLDRYSKTDDSQAPVVDLKEMLEEESRNLGSFLYRSGQARGGSAPIGGIFWCDFISEFNPIEGLTQIFGHTPVSKIKLRGENYNIDCLQYKQQVLKIDDTIEVITL